MKMKIKTARILLLWVFLWGVYPPWAHAATVGDIAQELTCTCGCNMLVSACEGTMDCHAAEDIKNQILAKLGKGMSREEILASFVSSYGEKILSSPTKRGFNLMAWVLPFAAAALGIGILYTLLKSWAPERKSKGSPVSFKPEDEVYLERVRKELEKYES